MKNEKEELKQDIEETGPDLKKIRESREMTLKDVFELTRIRVSILQAIENEDFHLLPEPVYARTFIKTYTKMLDIDGEKILSRYEGYLEQNEVPDEKETASRSSWFRSHRSLLVWIFSVLVVAVFLIFFFYPNHKTKQEIAGKPTGESKLVKDAKEKTADKINSKTETHATADKTASKQEDVAEEKPGATQDIANYKLTIEATEVTWLKIAEGDNPPEEILLKPGEKIHKETPDGFKIYIGNAGGVNVSFQGKPLGVLGEHGQVVHLTLPEDAEGGR
ncbi:MAG: helix-turn-helix domain-containing protein [Proteobacteria bacterium]|nr:helix-turn-helix domain-containing protein [Pseudomonadota bacterium]